MRDRPGFRHLPALMVLAAAVGVVAAAVGLVAAPPVGAQEAGADQRLAERYAPLVVVRDQLEACGDGEPYAPVAVDLVLGRDDVVLRGPDGEVVAAAPTAADLFGAGEGYHLDFPGDALDPGCDYEEWFDRIAEGQPATLYARVATDPGHPGRLALQYWFWWVYNDWNDKHEGDWEMVQLLFDAPTAEAALAAAPVAVAFAQHEGSETAPWDGDKVRREGDRMLVYPAAGSHAAFYRADRWFGKSAATGFGCDDTSPPSRRLDPEVVLVPTEVPSTPDDPFAWLAFAGRWGERQPSFNNGPTGPATKTQWAAPVAWVDDEGRSSSVSLPAGRSQATDFFCRASAAGSLLFIRLLDSPWVTLGAIVAVVAGLVLLVRSTVWRPGDPEPIARERRAGQIVTAALRFGRHHLGLVYPLGLVLAGAGAVTVAVQRVVLAVTPLGDVADVAGRDSLWGALVVLVIGAVVMVPAVALVLTAVAVVVREQAAGREVGPAGALRSALRPASGGLAALVLGGLVVVVPLLGPVLVVVVLWLLARWLVAPVACVHEGLGVRAGFRRSTQLSKGRRGTVLLTGVGSLAVGALAGPFVATLVLLVSSASFAAVNLVAALVNAFTVPTAGLVVAYLYHDLAARDAGRRVDPVSAGAGPTGSP